MLSIRRTIATTLAICIMGAGFPANSYAGMISSEAVISASDRDRIVSALDRADVRSQLSRLGVKPADVSARIAALTDAEAAQIARQIDELPAGGDGVGAVLGAIVLVFLVLLITDILGLTKVFPFTKPIR
jgi:hypothetical protein